MTAFSRERKLLTKRVAEKIGLVPLGAVDAGHEVPKTMYGAEEVVVNGGQSFGMK